MRNRNDYRLEVASRKVRNWRIVAIILALLAAYSFTARMDHAAQADRMHFENPAKPQNLSGGVQI